MTINYSLDQNGISETICPFNKHFKVGSAACDLCPSKITIDKFLRRVNCLGHEKVISTECKKYFQMRNKKGAK